MTTVVAQDFVYRSPPASPSADPRHRPRSAARRRRGATLLDSIGYLIIAAIVVAGVGYQMARALAGNDNQELASNLTQMVNDTQALYTGAAGYTGLSNSQLLSADAVPVGMQRSDGSGGTDVVSPWGTVTVAANTSDATRFDVALATVPTADCIKLLGSVNKAVDAAEVGSTALTLPLDLSAATTACGASDSQTVTLTYR